MVNREIIDRLLSKMRKSLKRLYELAKLEKGEYMNSDDSKALAEYHLRIAIQAVMDIGNRIIASEGWDMPNEYREILSILAKGSAISSELAGKVMDMIGMRNRLVHVYWDVDHNKVYEVLQSDLGDFEGYASSIVEFMEGDR